MFDIALDISGAFLVSFHSFFFIVFHGTDLYHSVFQITDVLFCLIYSAIDSLYYIFHFSYYILQLCFFVSLGFLTFCEKLLVPSCSVHMLFSWVPGSPLESLLWLLCRLHMSTSLSSSEVLSCSFTWSIFLCHLLLFKLLFVFYVCSRLFMFLTLEK